MDALRNRSPYSEEALALIAHELLTPLTCMLGWTQVAQHVPDMIAEALTTIEVNARRQQCAINLLLDRLRATPDPLASPRPAEEVRQLTAVCR